jgi:SAM-dependent methyltransferase
MSTLSFPILAGAVRERYAGLAGSCCSLSCGEALELAAPGEGEVLVDLGSGRGQDVVRAAGRVGALGQAVGVDFTDEMLERARASVPSALGNARFVKSDLEAIALPGGFADVVISNCTINHARDKAAVYREVFRILRPGGRFVVSDVVAEEELPASVRSDPAAWAACYGGAIPEPEYLAAVAAAGFGAVQVLHRTAPYGKGGVQVRSLTIRGEKP